MASRVIFDALPDDPESVRRILRENRSQVDKQLSNDYELAFSYLDGRQMEDLRSELQNRYTHTQSGKRGQEIVPVTLPLTERYVSEAASIYTHGVRRKLIPKEGDESSEQIEAMSKELERRLDEISYNERMQRVDEMMVLVGDAGLWFQVKSGKLRPVPVMPHKVYPVQPARGDFFDPSDQCDYAGYVVRVAFELDDALKGEQKQMFAFVTPSEVMFYAGTDPYEPEGEITRFPSPYAWPQFLETEDQKGSEAELPLQMFTIWSRKKPIDRLMLNSDPDIALSNRELNLQWTMILDTMRLQGWDVTVFNVMNPTEPMAQVAHGARFPVVLKVGETVQKIGNVAPYTSLTDALRGFIKTLAISHRMSPNDFAVEGVAPTSGFAKLVDSLPKIEARQERAARLKALEENLAWPRIAAIGVHLGWEGFTAESVKAVKLSVEFDELEFPRTVQEDIAEAEFELKHGLTTKARLLAKSRGISLEQAEQELEENRATGMGDGAQDTPPAPMRREPGQLLGQLIGRPGNGGRQQPDERSARGTARPGRMEERES